MSPWGHHVWLLSLLTAAAPAIAQSAQLAPIERGSIVPAWRSADASLRQSSQFQEPPTEEPPSTDAGQKPDQAPTGTSNDRLFWVLPNFLTVENADKLPPLTTKEKFAVTLRSSFDPIEIPCYAMIAGVSQAADKDPTYGQGALGYAKRFVLATTDGTIENFMVNAIGASALREDPRYYQRGKGGAWRRVGYALSRLVVTRSDHGNAQVNFAEILGSGTAAGLARIYHPAGDRTITSTLTSWATQLGYDGLAFVLKEFWPDIRRRFSKHSRTPATT